MATSTPFYFPVEEMKHFVAAIPVLLVFGICALAQGFRMDVGHFDPQGALTQSLSDPTPLADGCKGEVIEDTGGDGIAAPNADGSPGEGDAVLRVYSDREKDDGTPITFALNGAARLDMPGCFLIAPGASGSQLPQHRVFVRVWNAPDPALATGYWDSPLYELLPSAQQVSFSRSEWCWNLFTASAHRDVAVATQSALKAFPNPFNSSSRISFSLEQSETVKLAVYDLQARLVTTLVDAPLQSGKHDLVFDGSNLPSGLYFLRLQAGHDVSQVTRLLLLR